MIQEDYVSFEVAKLLKEKGFDEPCYSYYMTTKTLHTTFHNRVHVEEEPHFNSGDLNGMYDVDEPSIEDICSAPTLQMAMKWLRETHQLHISVDINPIYGKTKNEKGRSTCGLLYWHYMASGEWLNEKRDPFKKAFVVSTKSYEEAIEAALKYCLENLI